MLNLFIYILCLTLLFLSIIIKSNNLKNSSICLSLTFIIYLFYSSINAIDSTNYIFTFDNPIYLNNKLFYYFTSMIKYTINDYKVYRALIGVISLLPIVCISLKEGGKRCLCFVLMLYMIFPMFQNIVALRNTLASSIVLLGLYWLFKHKDSIGNYILVSLVIVVSAQIHSNMYLYLIVFFIYMLLVKTRISYLKILIFVSMIACLIRFDFMINIINHFIPFGKRMYLIDVNKLGIGFILTIVWQVGYFFLLKKATKGLENKNLINDDNIKIYNFNKALLCIIPLYMINVLFFRMVRNIIIFEYIIIYKNSKARCIHKDYYVFILILLNIVLMIFEASGLISFISIIF